MEDAKEPGGVLLHVEDDGPLRAAEARQSRRGRVQAKAGVHSQLVSVCTDTHILHLNVVLLSVVLFLLFTRFLEQRI